MIEEFVLANLEKYTSENINLLDLLFAPQNASASPTTRYIDFIDNYSRHIRSNFWDHDLKNNLPFISFYVDDFNIGDYDGCKKDIIVKFRIFTKDIVNNYDQYLNSTLNERQFLSKLYSQIRKDFTSSPNLFQLNECSEYELVDCDTITITTFPFNTRAKVNGNINIITIDQNTNLKGNMELHEHEVRIPLTIYKLYKNCPCDTENVL